MQAFAKFAAAQLRKPSGFFGRRILLPFLNRGNVLINSHALELLVPVPDDRVLEIGFGGGDLMARLSAAVPRGHVTGVDFSPEAVQLCRKRFVNLVNEGRMELVCADVEHLPLPSDSFTKACSVNTIYFWPDPRKALAEIRRVLRDDGLLVLCFAPRRLMEGREVMRHGFTLYEPEEVAELLSQSGFHGRDFRYGKHRYGECVGVYGKK